MRSLMLVISVLAITLFVMARTQDASKQSDNQAKQNDQASQSQTNQSNAKSDKTMSGKVSSDRKTFVSDKDNQSYNVSNPDALKGHEGQEVGLIVQIDPDTNAIHIITVEPPPTQ